MTLNRWLVLAAALLVAGLTARLGLWQLDRAAQKTQLQQAIDERTALPLLAGDEWPTHPAQVPAVQHRRTALQGRWLNEQSIYLDNRPMAGRTGFYLVTPLQLSDGSAVLVQRGWVPRDLLDRTRVPPPPPAPGDAAVRVQGRIAPALARLYEFDAAASGPIRQNLPLEAYASETRLPLRPWVLIQDSTADTPPDGLLRQWPAPDAGVAKHHGYAFQWFSLSALTIGLYVWFQLIRPRRRSVRAGGR